LHIFIIPASNVHPDYELNNVQLQYIHTRKAD